MNQDQCRKDLADSVAVGPTARLVDTADNLPVAAIHRPVVLRAEVVAIHPAEAHLPEAAIHLAAARPPAGTGRPATRHPAEAHRQATGRLSLGMVGIPVPRPADRRVSHRRRAKRCFGSAWGAAACCC
jgi:hypothetical protein